MSDLYKFLVENDRVLNLYGQDRHLVLRDAGLPSLAGYDRTDIDVQHCFLQAEHDIAFSYLEAVRLVCSTGLESDYFVYPTNVAAALQEFDDTITTILRQHRISFELVGNEFVAFESREMHTAVVVPTLTLLSNGAYREAEIAYQEALSEIGNEKPDDAITDAVRALEITLGTLGCAGNTLGKKLSEARKRNLLGDHDTQLTEAILKIGSWIAADRASKGDAHPGGSATIDDAWLIVHMVGALILRLSRTPTRGDSS